MYFSPKSSTSPSVSSETGRDLISISLPGLTICNPSNKNCGLSWPSFYFKYSTLNQKQVRQAPAVFKESKFHKPIFGKNWKTGKMFALFAQSTKIQDINL